MERFDHERLDAFRVAIEFVVTANEIAEQLPRGKGRFAILAWACLLLVLGAGCAPTQFPLFDKDGDQALVGEDCNDEDPGIGARYLDTDHDGQGLPDARSGCAAGEGEYASVPGDCNDTDADIYSGAPELCDGKDNDCDSEIDEGLESWVVFQDEDDDGFGADGALESCEKDAGYADVGGDCDDASASTYPGALETCNERDDDCDLEVDEGVLGTYYQDMDGDGFGADEATQQACGQPDGFTETGDDCDDNDADVNPDALEVCDAQDNDCDGEMDEGVMQSYYLDVDQDGFGDSGTESAACSPPDANYVLTDGDCDDMSALAYPGNTELCDETDNDCDGETDEGVSTLYYEDLDGDGHGNSETGIQSCAPLGDGYIEEAGDCDDGDPGAYPGGEEICNATDDNCDGTIDEGLLNVYYQDQDGDGYGVSSAATQTCQLPEGYAELDGDCDDTLLWVYPGATERCDELDNDCNGQPDDGLTRSVWYRDGDGDGFGSEPVIRDGCVQEDGDVRARGDCDDADPATHPGADDSPDTPVDEDCGGTNGPEPHVGFGTPSSLTSIAEALQNTESGRTIWVNRGTYLERNISFDGKEVSLQSTHFAEETIIDVSGSPEDEARAFVFSSGESNLCTLDGFTIVGGHMGTGEGGAILVTSSSPTLRGLYLYHNQAERGGAIYIQAGSPQILGVYAGWNTAAEGGAVYSSQSNAYLSQGYLHDNVSSEGGAVWIEGGEPTLENLLLSSNQAASGGAAFLSDTGARLENCVIAANTASVSGGGVAAVDSRPLGINSVFYGNTAGELGGGLYLESSTIHLENTIFASNIAQNGGGIWIDTIDSTTLVLVNSILAYNDGLDLYTEDELDTSSIRYSDFYASDGGAGHNITLDPSNLELEPAFAVYDLEGRPEDLHLSLESPLVDAGIPEIYDPDGGRSDLGAFGGPGAVSRDLDGDGAPDFFWPGDLESAPDGVEAASFDCNDQNPDVVSCFE